MTNHQIADYFELYAKLLDLHGENSFKVKSYANAAFTIDKWMSPLAEMDEAAIAAIRGVGAAIAEKISVLLKTGELAPLQEILLQTPPGNCLALERLGHREYWRIRICLSRKQITWSQRIWRKNATKHFTTNPIYAATKRLVFMG